MIAQVRRAPSPLPGTMQRFVSSQATRPSSYNPEARTVEAVLATDYPVKRSNYIEVLKIEPNAIDLSRVEGGSCKLLDTHRQESIKDIVGTVQACWIENGQLVGRLRFADNAGGREAEQGVADGHLVGISAGYRVLEAKVIEQGSRVEDDTVQITRWVLLEASLVATPADPHSKVRHELPIRHALAEALTPALEDDVTALRLAVFEADERHGELLDQWYDNTEASGLRPDTEDVQAAEDDLDVAKARLERAERRERAIQQAMRR